MYSVGCANLPAEQEMVVEKEVAEGKTKVICTIKNQPGLVLIRSKDRITAGDGARAHDLEGKAKISTATNGGIYDLLNRAGRCKT
jgi:phosphoribosylaminoimidazole carboxylase / phosphoribosylaminoimidazole-succinocarboxamide synthase